MVNVPTNGSTSMRDDECSCRSPKNENNSNLFGSAQFEKRHVSCWGYTRTNTSFKCIFTVIWFGFVLFSTIPRNLHSHMGAISLESNILHMFYVNSKNPEPAQTTRQLWVFLWVCTEGFLLRRTSKHFTSYKPPVVCHSVSQSVVFPTKCSVVQKKNMY